MTNIFDKLTLSTTYGICWFMHSGEDATVAKFAMSPEDVAYVKSVIAELDTVIEPEKIRGYVGNYAIYQFAEDLLSMLTLEFDKVSRERPLFAKTFEDNATHVHTYVPPQLASIRAAAESMKLTPEEMRAVEQQYGGSKHAIATAPDTYLNKMLPGYAYIEYLELKIAADGEVSADNPLIDELRAAYVQLRDYFSAERQQAIDSDRIVADFIAFANGEGELTFVHNRALPSKH